MIGTFLCAPFDEQILRHVQPESVLDRMAPVGLRRRGAGRHDDDRGGDGVACTAFRTVDVIEGLVSGRSRESARERVSVRRRERIRDCRKQSQPPTAELIGPLTHGASRSCRIDED